jgi:hypothetical protein
MRINLESTKYKNCQYKSMGLHTSIPCFLLLRILYILKYYHIIEHSIDMITFEQLSSLI